MLFSYVRKAFLMWISPLRLDSVCITIVVLCFPNPLALSNEGVSLSFVFTNTILTYYLTSSAPTNTILWTQNTIMSFSAQEYVWIFLFNAISFERLQAV